MSIYTIKVGNFYLKSEDGEISLSNKIKKITKDNLFYIFKNRVSNISDENLYIRRDKVLGLKNKVSIQKIKFRIIGKRRGFNIYNLIYDGKYIQLDRFKNLICDEFHPLSNIKFIIKKINISEI